MGQESNPPHTPGKRSRPAEDEVYLDNYHTHKRYLSEVMASSLNGLKVGDSVPEKEKPLSQVSDFMESSRSASSFPSNGEDLSTLDSPMSDDSDESIGYRAGRYNETPPRFPVSLLDPRTLGSPCKSHKISSGASTNNTVAAVAGSSSSLLPCSSSAVVASLFPSSSSSSLALPSPCSQLRKWAAAAAADTDARYPPSPSDPCQSADLRRTALLRSSHRRAQSPAASSSSSATAAEDGAERGRRNIVVAEDRRSCSVEMAEYSDDAAAIIAAAVRSPVRDGVMADSDDGAERGQHNVINMVEDQPSCSIEMSRYCDDTDGGGSPVHGVFTYHQGGIRGSMGHVRSLLLDGCSRVAAADRHNAVSLAPDISNSSKRERPPDGYIHTESTLSGICLPDSIAEEVSESAGKVGGMSEEDIVR